MRRSRIPKHSCRHIYSRCEVRSCGAGMHRSAAEGRFGEAEPAAMTRPQVASRSEVARGLRASVCAGARTLGVNMLSENAFREMPTLADKSSDFGFSSGIQVYFWTQRISLQVPIPADRSAQRPTHHPSAPEGQHPNDCVKNPQPRVHHPRPTRHNAIRLTHRPPHFLCLNLHRLIRSFIHGRLTTPSQTSCEKNVLAGTTTGSIRAKQSASTNGSSKTIWNA